MADQFNPPVQYSESHLLIKNATGKTIEIF